MYSNKIFEFRYIHCILFSITYMEDLDITNKRRQILEREADIAINARIKELSGMEIEDTSKLTPEDYRLFKDVIIKSRKAKSTLRKLVVLLIVEYNNNVPAFSGQSKCTKSRR